MSQGFTGSENYLLQLARRSFLRLWSWPNLFRDQKASGGSDGKELCDLLVVFGRDVIIFSDKLCEFPNSGDLQLDWCRWYKRAIHKSANQALGAKRWLENYPDRVYVDATCQTSLPITIPNEKVRFHLVVVAHGSGEPCSRYFKDSASLMVNTRIVGEAHMTPREQVQPFTVGIVNEKGPFVHVLDDSSLDTLLNYLDTAGDLVEYLTAREKFLGSRLVVTVGEEELLGFYMSKFENGRRDFVVPSSVNAVLVDLAWLYQFRLVPSEKRG